MLLLNVMKREEKKKKKYPKSLRKHIRKEKALIRKNEINPKKQKEEIEKLYKKLKSVV